MSITSSTIGKRTFKVILLGDSATGKTSIIQRFVNNKFQERDNPTIGIDFLGKNITHKSTTCRLQLWDTAGQERYKSLIPSYLKDAVCAIFVFDLARRETLENLQSWINLFKDNRQQKTVMVICGNKNDTLQDIDKTLLNNLIQKNKVRYFQTSALTGQNIQNMFFTIIDDIVILQKSKSKKIKPQEEYVHPPLTSDTLKSEHTTGKNNDQSQQDTQHIKLKGESGGRKYCCF